MVILPQVVKRTVSSYDECMAALETAVDKRKVAGHAMNEWSSRSNMMVFLKIRSTYKTTGQLAQGKLTLDELVGSERIGLTKEI